ncbi:MAG: Uma2 family endonuclease [Deltaproteobacteria bacterium]|nr:Uma2 family endonuclease [Deltaproteobacteria bacterium]
MGRTCPEGSSDLEDVCCILAGVPRAIDQPRDDRPSDDRIVRLYPATWADYQRLLEIRGDRSAPRLTYLEGEIEIMSPSRRHESIKSKIGHLVEVYCLENGIEFNAYGSWTLEKKEEERGAEPDECYVFGDVSEPERPDLAIEVVWTSGRIDKLKVYRALGVREVWYWRQGRIQPFVLRGSSYRPVARSKALPGLDLEQLASFLDRPTASRAIRDYRAALRRRTRAT